MNGFIRNHRKKWPPKNFYNVSFVFFFWFFMLSYIESGSFYISNIE